jgi:hypothetical protein
VLKSTPRTPAPVAVHRMRILPTRDPRHDVLSSMQIAAIRALLLSRTEARDDRG